MQSKIFAMEIVVPMAIGPDIKDITHEVQLSVQESAIQTGIASCMVVGSTGSITTIEYEPGVIEDLKDAFNRLAPPDLDYKHELAWHDGNGHSHVQAALLGPSLTVPVRRGSLVLGTWQQIVVCNHDNKARNRRVEITIIGA